MTRADKQRLKAVMRFLSQRKDGYSVNLEPLHGHFIEKLINKHLDEKKL